MEQFQEGAGCNIRFKRKGIGKERSRVSLPLRLHLAASIGHPRANPNHRSNTTVRPRERDASGKGTTAGRNSREGKQGDRRQSSRPPEAAGTAATGAATRRRRTPVSSLPLPMYLEVVAAHSRRRSV